MIENVYTILRCQTPMASEEFILKRAAASALRSPLRNHRHGCIIVRNGEIVSEGYNHNFVHMFHLHSVHAEVDALSKLPRNKKFMSQCDMYVVRIGTDNMGNPLKLSKPCNSCTQAILKAGIRRVYYS